MIRNYLLDEDVAAFAAKSNTDSFIKKLSCLIETKLGKFVAIKVISLSEDDDYVFNYSTIVKLKVRLGLGDFMHRIFPSRNNIDIILRTQNGSDKPVQRSYIAFINLKNIPNYVGEGMNSLHIDTLNNAETIDVEFQLIDKDVYTLKNRFCKAGIESNKKPKDLIVEQLEGFSKGTGIKSVNIVEPNQTKERKHINIHNGIHISALPTFLQLKQGGVYNNGIGTFVSTYKGKKEWYVYPLYDTNRFLKSKERVVFILTPEGMYGNMECTHMVQGGVSKILITGVRKYIDTGATHSENDGVGFNVANADVFMKKPVDLSGDNPRAVGFELNRIEQVNVDNRIVNRPVGTASITDNLMQQRSEISFRNKANLIMTWHNSNNDLLHPGMPCKIITIVGNEIVAMYGALVGAQTYTNIEGNTTISQSYSSTTVVNVVVDNIKPNKINLSFSKREAVNGQM